MYESFYGLTSKPFQLNPDPSFYFASKQHRRAMAYLEYGLNQNEGFIVVTGEVGAGKTTIVRGLLNDLDSEKVVAAQLVSTQLDAEDILRMVAAAFGVGARNMGKSELLLALEAYLVDVTRQGRRCLLIVDEAQNLTPRAVEELRMLSNFPVWHASLAAKLPDRSARVPEDHAKSADAAIAPARDRRLPYWPDGSGRNAGVYRAPAQVRRIERLAALRRGGLRSAFRGQWGRSPTHQFALRSAAPGRLSQRQERIHACRCRGRGQGDQGRDPVGNRRPPSEMATRRRRSPTRN
jgi:hypothetical protein